MSNFRAKIYGMTAVSIAAGSLLTSAIFTIAQNSSAHAANSGSLDYSVRIKASMDMTISSDSVALTLNPANNAFGTGALNIAVGTNNPGGYRLFMSTDDGSTSLVKTDDDTKTIETLPSNGSTGYTADTFVADKWGYKVGSGNYFPFVSGGMVNSSSTAVNNHITNITFGAKASYEKTAGTYNTTLSFTTLPKVTTYNMQDSNVAEVCTETPALVTDSRDGQAYLIARLADGQCWMVQNLNLAGGTALYSDDSDVAPANTKASGNPYFTLPASETITSGTSLPSTAFSDSSTAYVFNSGNKTTDQADCTSSKPCNSYYSWLAATAGGKDANGNAVTDNGYNAAYSVCPKGWKLPTTTTSNAPATTSPNWKTGDFYKVASAYGANLESQHSESSATFYDNAGPGTLPNFLLTGYYDGGLFVGGSSESYYWSSSSYSTTFAYYLNFNSGYVALADFYYRGVGYPVRCVLKEGPSSIDEIESMQELGTLDSDTKATILGSMDITKSYALKDTRDDKYYNIAKLADGKVWMTTSLNLAGGAKLYSETSDVPAGYSESGGTGYFTLPTSSTSGFSDDTVAYVYNAPNKNNPDPSNPTTCTPANGSPCDSYYSWLTATAGGKDASGSAVTGNGPDTAYSVCPKGWRLPKSGDYNDTSATSTTGYKKGDFYKLATAYGANLESQYYESAATFYNNAGPGTLPNFLLAGYYGSSSFYSGGSYGYYWSSSSYSSTDAYNLYFGSSHVNSAFNLYRRYGFPVRCILRES